MSVSLPDLISEVKNVWSSGCNISSIRVYYLFNDLETSLRHHQPAVLLRGHLQYHPCHTGIIQLFYSINNRVGDLRRSRWSTARCRAWRLDRVYLQCVLIISTQFLDIKTNFKTLNLLVYINKCSIGSKCNLMERGNAKKIFPRKCRLPSKLSNDHYFIETCIILRAVKLCYSRMPQWIIKRGRLVYILGLGWDKTLSGPRAAAGTG